MIGRAACRGGDVVTINEPHVRCCENRGFVFRKSIVLHFILLFLLPAVSSRANDIVVLKSANIKPYEDALKGFESSCGCNVQEVNPGRFGAGTVERGRFNGDMVLAQIGKNVSGVSMDIPPAIILGTIQEVFPGATRVGVIYDPRHYDSFITEALYAAQQRGIRLVLKAAGKPSEVPSLIDEMRGNIDVFWMLPDVTVVTPETVKYLLLFSFRNKVPVFSFSGKYVEMGALAALNIVPFDIGVQAGELAMKLSSGRNNGTPIRVEARKTELSVNQTVARKLGIRMIDDVLRRADHVY
jgi:putative ABC transport system substrate-binding protein